MKRSMPLSSFLTSLVAVASSVVLSSALAGCPSTVNSAASPASQASPVAAASDAAKPVSCESASLALASSTVIGTLNGTKVTAKDLGEDLKSAESKALRTYCDAVNGARSTAFENYVNEQLIQTAAKAKSMTVEAYVKERVDAATATPPSDDDARAWFEKRRSTDMPPFDVMKPQVIAAMQQEVAKATLGAMINELRHDAKVVNQFPDVRPPAVDLTPAKHTAVAGNPNAKVHVVEFADFQCPYCSIAAKTMHALKEKYKDRVKFSFRHFPLSFHSHAKKAAEYAQCAQAQDKFWPMHDRIFGNQKNLEEETLKGYVTELGMDQVQFDACLSSGKGKAEVAVDQAKGNQVGVSGTPSFFIDGRPYQGNPDVDGLSQAIEAELSSQ